MQQRRTRWWNVFVPLLCSGLLTLGLASAEAVDNDESRATLRGVSAIEVGVGEIPPAVVHAGVTQEGIRHEIEQHLRHAGVTLLTRKALLQRPNAAFVAVSVGIVRHPRGQMYAYAIDVSVYQTATLTRNTALTLSLPTWSSASFGLVGSTALHELLPRVSEQVVQFVKAYRLMNPRTGEQRLVPVKPAIPNRPRDTRGRPRGQQHASEARPTR